MNSAIWTLPLSWQKAALSLISMETWTWNPDYFIDLTDHDGMQSIRSDWKQTPCYSGLGHHWFNLSCSNWITFAWRTRDLEEPSLARPGGIEDTINVNAQIPYPWSNDFCEDNNCKAQMIRPTIKSPRLQMLILQVNYRFNNQDERSCPNLPVKHCLDLLRSNW